VVLDLLRVPAAANPEQKTPAGDLIDRSDLALREIVSNGSPGYKQL